MSLNFQRNGSLAESEFANIISRNIKKFICFGNAFVILLSLLESFALTTGTRVLPVDW
jgi:hypothetical protein